MAVTSPTKLGNELCDHHARLVDESNGINDVFPKVDQSLKELVDRPEQPVGGTEKCADRIGNQRDNGCSRCRHAKCSNLRLRLRRRYQSKTDQRNK